MSRTTDRRSFLKTMAAVAAAALLTPGEVLARPARGAASVKTMAVLAGRSRLQPAFTTNLTLGLRLGAEAAGQTPNVQLPEAGTSTFQMLSAATRSLRQDRPDYLIAIQHPGAAPELGEVARAERARVVLLDSGANVPRFYESHAHVQLAGMGQWRSDYALGRWAAMQGARTAAILTSLYDTGYDLISAYSAGFQSGGGNEPTVILTDDPHVPGASAGAALEAVGRLSPDVVHVLHSGRSSAEIQSSLVSSHRGMLTASSLILDDAAGRGFRSVSAWLQPDSGLAGNVRILTGGSPDEVTVFGYRTGLALAGGGSTDAAGLHLFETGVFNGQAGRRVIAQLPDVTGTDPRIAALAAAQRTGWSTPWLML